MRGKSEYPTRHGDQHLANGSDPIAGIGGIQFDTYPQSGGYLEIATTGDHFGSGIHLDSSSLTTVHSDINVVLDADSNVNLTADADINLTSDNITATVATDEHHTVGGQFLVDAASLDLDGDVSTHGGSVTVQLPLGDTLTVQDHLGNPIFRVDEDGDIHIKTGKTIAADL